jgi:hypothetical protein
VSALPQLLKARPVFSEANTSVLVVTDCAAMTARIRSVIGTSCRSPVLAHRRSACSRIIFRSFLHPDDVRWAAAEGVCEDIIAAVLLLHERSVDEIVPKLRAAEFEQLIKVRRILC